MQDMKFYILISAVLIAVILILIFGIGIIWKWL